MSEDINVGAISEALNNKVDLNQMNTNAQGLSYASGWGMPSSRYTDLELGASGSTYTAPANGYVYLDKVAGQTPSYISIGTDSFASASYSNYYTNKLSVYVPIIKGGKFRVTYDVTGETNYFRFIYTEGEQ